MLVIFAQSCFELRQTRAVKASSTGQTTGRLWSIRSKNFQRETTTFTTQRRSQARAQQTGRIQRGSWVPCRFDKVRCCVTHHAHATVGYCSHGRFACCALSSPSIAPLAVLRRALLCMWRYRIRAWLLHKTHRHTHNDLLERDIASEKCTSVTCSARSSEPLLNQPSLIDRDGIAQ